MDEKELDKGEKIVLDQNKMSTIEVSSDPMSEGRDDRKLVFSHGDVKVRLANLLLGYNKNKLVLPNGNFVNTEELIEATLDEIDRIERDEHVVICTKTGERVSKSDLEAFVQDVIDITGKLVVSRPSSNAAEIDAYGAHDGPKQDGYSFIKEDLELPAGTYINFDEFKNALDTYLKTEDRTKPIIPPTPTPVVEDTPHIVTRKSSEYKTKLRAKLVPAIMSATLIASSFIFPTKVVSKVETQTAQNFQNTQIGYTLKDRDQVVSYDGNGNYTIDFSRINMDQKVSISPETEITRLGNGGGGYLAGKAGHGDISNVGISGFSAYGPDGKLVAYAEEMYSGKEQRTNQEMFNSNLDTFINQILEEHPGLSKEDLDIHIHVGYTDSHDRLGWFSLSELAKNQQITFHTDENAKTYSGVTKDGQHAEFKTDDGEVVVDLYDDNGNLLPNGSVVIGSDGETYTILSSNTSVRKATALTTDESISTESRPNETLLVSGSILACADIAMAYAMKKEEERLNENAKVSHEQADDEVEYKQILEDFKKSQATWDEKSKFGKLISKLFTKRDTIQRLTEDQVVEVYGILKQNYGDDANIRIENGKFVLIKEDGTKTDISEEAFDSLKNIGKEDEIAAKSQAAK